MHRDKCRRRYRNKGSECVLGLGAHVLGVDVSAGVDVVDQVPSFMVGVVVDDKVVAIAIPAPIGREIPIE